MEKTVNLEIKKLGAMDSLYPRKEVDRITIERYQEAMQNGEKFPPILVGLFEDEYYIIDGAHRTAATERLDHKTISAIVKTYTSEKAMYLDAIETNMHHGKPLSYYERKVIASKLKMKFKLSETEVSKIVAFDVNIIKKIKKNSFSRFTLKERAPELPHKNPEEEARKLLTPNEFTPYREINDFLIYLKLHQITIKEFQAQPGLRAIYEILKPRFE